MFLKEVKYQKNKKPSGNNKFLSYKVLIVKTERHYKCPNGCALTEVKTYS